MDELNTKLEAARAAFAAAKTAYSKASLSYQEGTASVTALHDATSELHTAEARLNELNAAMEAAQAREQERLQEATAEEQRAHGARVNEALREVNEAAELWDVALDALATITKRYLAAVTTLHHCGPSGEVMRKLADAQRAVETIIGHKLQPLVARRAVFFTDEMARITHHLPRLAGE
jgi:hypothetical protein